MDHFATSKVRGFGTSVFAEMSRLSVEHNAVNLGQGFPDFPGPAFAKEAAKRAIDADLNQYAISHGQPRLRRAIAAMYASQTGHEVNPDSDITVASGATEVIFDAIQAFIGVGDELIAFEPFYDSYPASTILAGGVFKPIRLHPPDWSFDLEALRRAITPRTRVILLNTPHNPTGKVFTEAELQAVADLAIAHDLVVLSDEVYDRITYGGAVHRSIALLPRMWDRTLTINSTGKTFSMTGWKIGFAIGPAALNAALRAVHQFVTFASATPFQEAMAESLELAQQSDYYATLARDYDARRVLLTNALEAAGLPILPISGSYFLMADFAALGFPNDVAFCRWLVSEIGVAAVPPSAFYQQPETAPLLARFCFAKRAETITEAANRLQRIPTVLHR
ncbi:MAG TPA: methionine aminotransferase [Thermomicrobiales bacterium]|nr:methionine aminotransferase [Thermomicrobiales bacterium]